MESESRKTDSYRFGPFRVDPLERRLLRDDNPVALTPKAFDLLLALVENPGRLLQKDALMKLVWADAFVEEANQANNISLLRKALGDGNGATEYIETVPRRGYRFLAEVTVSHLNNHQPVPQASAIPASEPPSDLAAATESARATTVANRRERVLAVAAIVLVVVGIAIATRYVSSSMSNPPLVRFKVMPPPGASLAQMPQPLAPAMSPDGTRLVFRVLRAGEPLLAIRSLDALDAQVLAGTERARFPFWSPDSRVVAFFADGKLKKIDAAGGPVQTICDAAPGFGGSWNRDGVIVFAPSAMEGLFRVPAVGGKPIPVTPLRKDEAFHQHPQFLPDGHRFLYFAAPDGVYLGSLDDDTPIRILTNTRMALYSSGHLLFVQDRTLFAQRFDLDRPGLSGDPVPLGDDVQTGGANVEGRAVGGAAIAVSENGVLAYGRYAPVHQRLLWLDRAGRVVASIDGPKQFATAELSPDGKQIAMEISARPDAADVWLVDLANGHSNQLTFDSGASRRPIWSPDGRRLVFASSRPEAPGLYQKIATGEKPEELLLRSDSRFPGRRILPSDWTSSGIVYEIQGDGAWILPLGGDGRPHLLVREPLSLPDAKLSPNAKWLAYSSDQSGRPEVFVVSVSTPAAKWRISAEGGERPRWRRDGKELFYIAADGKAMSVSVEADSSTLHPGRPQPLFQTGLSELPTRLRSYDVSPDGQRFLVAMSTESGSTLALVVVSNWQTVLKR